MTADVQFEDDDETGGYIVWIGDTIIGKVAKTTNRPATGRASIRWTARAVDGRVYRNRHTRRDAVAMLVRHHLAHA